MKTFSTAARAAPDTAVKAVELDFQIRWLGRVEYRDALALQHAIFRNTDSNYLLLLEHPHVFTVGSRGDMSNLLVNRKDLGTDLVKVDRGGDITYHGPGQLVGYPILSVPGKRGGGMIDTAQYVETVEQVLIDSLAAIGLADCGRLIGHPGVWVEPASQNPRKIAAVGIRLTRGRSMHGFALNLDPDMKQYDSIIPCGIADKPVTSLVAEGVVVTMKDMVDSLCHFAEKTWASRGVRREDVAWRVRSADLSAFSRGEGPGEVPIASQPAADLGLTKNAPVRLLGRLAEAGVESGLQLADRKPEWMRVKVNIGPEYLRLKRVMRDLDLVTVCEEAGCSNIFDCWNDGTATFMILGNRCTRKCGFCLIDTQKPEVVDKAEPVRVAEAVGKMALSYVVVTMVARDDLADGGAGAMSATVAEIRDRNPETKIEVLISDLKGNPDDLQVVFDARPDVLNHNIETVPRLQRAVRPSAGYARSLAVLSRSKQAGLISKTSMILGMGETRSEVVSVLLDLASIGVDIVTLGQYLRPTTNHIPIDRWWHPEEFSELKDIGEGLGISHIQASPLTRSSFHAREAELLLDDR